jgi:hypothetical protein
VSNIYKHVIAADFEFNFGGHAGEIPRPVCMVAQDLCTGQEWRLFEGDFGPIPPFPIGDDAVFVAYYASAELGCFRALGWPMPVNIIDLFVEFRDRTNLIAQRRKPGVKPPGASLIDALSYFGLDTIGAIEKDEMRSLVLRGGPYTEEEKRRILDYCASDVAALRRLLPAMLPQLDVLHAMLRGRYMAAAAAMEYVGVPIDTVVLGLLREHWTDIQDDLIAAIDAQYHVFDGRTFKVDWWAAYLVANNYPWPRREDGQLDLEDKTFREMAKAYPAISPMRELRHTLSGMRRSGPGYLNRISASIGGASAGVKLPSGRAAA